MLHFQGFNPTRGGSTQPWMVATSQASYDRPQEKGDEKERLNQRTKRATSLATLTVPSADPIPLQTPKTGLLMSADWMTQPLLFSQSSFKMEKKKKEKKNLQLAARFISGQPWPSLSGGGTFEVTRFIVAPPQMRWKWPGCRWNFKCD